MNVLLAVWVMAVVVAMAAFPRLIRLLGDRCGGSAAGEARGSWEERLTIGVGEAILTAGAVGGVLLLVR